MKRKHKKDGKHGKRGWVGGNPRYDRKADKSRKNLTMGKN